MRKVLRPCAVPILELNEVFPLQQTQDIYPQKQLIHELPTQHLPNRLPGTEIRSVTLLFLINFY